MVAVSCSPLACMDLAVDSLAGVQTVGRRRRVAESATRTCRLGDGCAGVAARDVPAGQGGPRPVGRRPRLEYAVVLQRLALAAEDDTDGPLLEQMALCSKDARPASTP